MIIGSVLSTTAGSILCTVPVGLAPGSGYRVRVVGNAPVVIGTINGNDLTFSIAPSAGSDAAVSNCGSAIIDLFDALGGIPDACGTWTDPFDDPTTGLFDPASSPEGAYTYTTNCPGACPQDVAILLVESSEGIGAGNDVEAVICSNAPAFTPYAYIDGGAATGQFFYGGQPFPLPDLTEPGSYAFDYVVQGSQPCPNDTATMVFEVIAAPNAGATLSYTTCITTAPFQLVELLIGAEQDGTWTAPSGAGFSGTLDPASGSSGLYTYTVEGDAPCASAQSFVDLVIDPCSGILERSHAVRSIAWSGQFGTVHHIDLGGADGIDRLEVIDALGRAAVIGHVQRIGDRLAIDLVDAASGTYTVFVRSSTGVGTTRIVNEER